MLTVLIDIDLLAKENISISMGKSVTIFEREFPWKPPKSTTIHVSLTIFYSVIMQTVFFS